MVKSCGSVEVVHAALVSFGAVTVLEASVGSGEGDEVGRDDRSPASADSTSLKTMARAAVGPAPRMTLARSLPVEKVDFDGVRVFAQVDPVFGEVVERQGLVDLAGDLRSRPWSHHPPSRCRNASWPDVPASVSSDTASF